MKKIVIFYYISNNGDGSASIRWYLSGETAEKLDEDQYEGWGEECNGSIETFEGSDVHNRAVINQEEYDKTREV